jgi:iron complex outermembrane recepter protein
MKLSCFLRAGVACAFSVAVTAPTFAADGSEATIIVTGQKPSANAQALAKATPGGTDVVSHADYADKSIISLRDALAFSPGIYLQPRFGQEVRISIRGSGLSRGFHMRGLTLLQDGIPINLADDNGDFQELEPIFFDHLEVYRGSNALRFGSGTLGGAINGVTPKGTTAQGLYTRLDVGSFNFVRGLAAFGAGNSDADAWAALSVDRHDGDRDHATRKSIRFHGNVGLQISPIVATRFYASANSIDQKLPGALNRVTALTAPKTGNFTGDQARDIVSLRLQNRTSFNWGATRMELGTFLNAKQLFHPIFQVIDQKSTDRGFTVRMDHEVGGFAITLGGESRWGTTNARRFININGQRGAQTFGARQTARTSNLYAETRLEMIAGLTAVAGGIYANGQRQQVQSSPVAITGQARFDAFSPKLGLLWQANPDIQLYGNYSRSAEFPTFVELAQVASFVPLRKQRAGTAEIGTRGNMGAVKWDLSLYRSDIRGELLQFIINPDIPASTFNADRTLHQGVELAVTIQPAPWLRLRQNWQYSDFRFVNDRQYGNNQLPIIPKNVLRTEVRIGNDNTHIAANVEWVPKGAWADYRNTARTSSYALLGVTGGVKLDDKIDLFVDVRNVTGKKAIGDVSAVIAATNASSIYYPVERRAIYGGIRARF